MLEGLQEGLKSIEGLSDDQQKLISDLGNSLSLGLVDKNTELLGKLGKVKGDAGTSAAELESLKQFKHNADVKSAEDAKNWSEASRLKDETHQADLEKSSEKVTVLESTVKKLLIDNGLNVALDGVNINPALKEGALAIMKSSAQIVDGEAMIGDKTLSDYVTTWAESDTGKAFCNAPNNSGSGSGGGGKEGNDNSFSTMTLTEKTQLANSDPAKYKLLANG